MPRHWIPTAMLVCVVLAVSACNRPRHAGAGQDAGDDATNLPVPDAGKGSVTGMPDKPGPGAVGPPPGTSEAIASDDALADIIDASTTAATVPDEPTADDAVALVRSYYAAIVAHEYPRAYSLWSNDGVASGQSAAQFAAGFADTTDVVVEPGAPGQVEGAVGSRFIEVPVSIRATKADGSVHRYLGSYTLRRAVVDGASATQRAWRIASADIREAR